MTRVFPYFLTMLTQSLHPFNFNVVLLIILAVSVIMRRPTSHDVNLLVYLEVFTIASTVFIVAFIALVALLFTCVACFVKHDALHADPDREEFNLLSGLALAAGILGQLGYPIGESCCHLATFH